MGAIILNGAKIGKGSIIGAGSVIKENMQIPPYSLVVRMHWIRFSQIGSLV